jgi:hypothetical protein
MTGLGLWSENMYSNLSTGNDYYVAASWEGVGE